MALDVIGTDGTNPDLFGDAMKVGGDIFSAVQGGINAAAPYASLAMSYVSAQRQQAAAYYQQGLYEVQAIDTLRLAQIRTDQDRKYASIQAGRKLKAAEMTALNYTIQATPCCVAWRGQTLPCVPELPPTVSPSPRDLQQLCSAPMWGPPTAMSASPTSTP